MSESSASGESWWVITSRGMATRSGDGDVRLHELRAARAVKLKRDHLQLSG